MCSISIAKLVKIVDFIAYKSESINYIDLESDVNQFFFELKLAGRNKMFNFAPN